MLIYQQYSLLELKVHKGNASYIIITYLFKAPYCYSNASFLLCTINIQGFNNMCLPPLHQNKRKPKRLSFQRLIFQNQDTNTLSDYFLKIDNIERGFKKKSFMRTWAIAF